MSKIVTSPRLRNANLYTRILCAAVQHLDFVSRVGQHAFAVSEKNGALISTYVARSRLWGKLQKGPLKAPMPKRLLALSFDLDYDTDTESLLPLIKLVGKYDIKMSLASIGKLVEANPLPYEAAVDAGHEIVNHTYSHPNNPILNPDKEFWYLSTEEMAEEIGKAQDVFIRYLGIKPVGFRSPHFKDAHRMLSVLESFPEIRYASSVIATATPTGLPYFPALAAIASAHSHMFASIYDAENSRLLMIPLTPCPEHRHSPFCSYHCIRQPKSIEWDRGRHSLREFSGLWAEMLKINEETGFVSVYFDPMDVVGTPDITKSFDLMLKTALDAGWEITTLAHVERVWRNYLESGQVNE